DLVTRTQELQLARTKANWQKQIYETTVELIDRLKAGDTPEQLHDRFQDRPLGPNREKLISAYAEFRLARATLKRNEALRSSTQAISQKQYEQALAGYEAAVATYQALMDSMGFEAKITHDMAQQDLRAAETAVRVAKENLRVMGLNADGS